jgi:hypothetical protein
MAIAYKSKVFSNSAANTSQALFTAVASNTLVKSIICNNDGKTTGTATLRINESGGTSKLIRRVTIASGDTSVELLYDVLALEAGDILYVTSTDTDIVFIMSYAEDSESLVLQSIDVLSDVNTTGKVDGDVLTWDSTTSKWIAEAGGGGGGATILNDLTDVTIVDPLDHDSLVYDEATSQWINGAPKAFDLPVYAASAIAKGKLLKAVGAQGDKVSVGLFDLDVDDAKNLIGISVDAISAGGTGHARAFGELRGISTNSYSIGTILYASGTAGELSSTAGVPEIPVAIVIRSQLNTGRLFVRTWVPTASKVYSVNGNTGSVILDAADIYRVGSSGDTIDTDLTAAENNINSIKAVLKYPSSSLTGLQVNTTNKLEIDSTTQKAVFTINGSTAATIGPSQSLFPQVRIGTTGDTYDLPITRGSNDGEVPVYTATTNTSEWRTLQTSNLGGTSDGITQGTTNLFFTSAEQTKLAGITAGAAVASVTGTAPIVSSGGTTPAISITAATTLAAGSMSSADKSKLDGIEAGAQVNAVTSVNTQTGAVVLTTSNIAEGTNQYFTNARADARTLAEKDQTLTGPRAIQLNGDSIEIQNSAVTILGVDGGGIYGNGGFTYNGITYPSTDGTSGQVMSTNGAGTISFVTKKATQVTGKTVLTGAWSLVSGVYEASISDANILSTSIVNVIPDNGSAATIRTAQMLPRTDSSAGAVKIYSTNLPAASITVTLNIFDL